MKVAVLGLGYVGSVTAACLAKEGHHVVGVDLDVRKVDLINEGRSPIIEPGLDDLVAEARRSGRLRAVTNLVEGVAGADVSIVCVGTPSQANGEIDLRFVERVAADIGQILAASSDPHVVMFRSTMLPGTVESCLVPILEASSGRQRGPALGVAMCPEFLREARGIKDFYDPPFTVVGTSDASAAVAVQRLLSFLDAPVHVVDLAVAESLKYACNAFHAVKVSFANEIGRLCQASGADSRQVMELFCQDTQLNVSPVYLRPGFSFGGSCLPKDVRALVHRARSLDLDLPLVASTLASNDIHLRKAFDWVLATGSRSVALFGLSFKSGTDDLRESPCVELAELLVGKGIDLRIYDANVRPGQLYGANEVYVERHLPHLSRLLVASPGEALEGASCAVVSAADASVVAALTAQPPGFLLDVSGSLGAAVEALSGYAGVAW